VVKRWDNLNVPLHALAYVLTPKYYSSSWLAQPTPGGGERRKPHIDLEVQNGYMLALDKLVHDEEECAQVRSELSKYISEHGVFGNLRATKDRDMMGSIEWWNMYGSYANNLHKLAVKVLSQVPLNEPCVANSPLFKINKCSKVLYNLPNLSMGGLSW
jgi:hypothetical protein